MRRRVPSPVGVSLHKWGGCWIRTNVLRVGSLRAGDRNSCLEPSAGIEPVVPVYKTGSRPSRFSRAGARPSRGAVALSGYEPVGALQRRVRVGPIRGTDERKKSGSRCAGPKAAPARAGGKIRAVRVQWPLVSHPKWGALPLGDNPKSGRLESNQHLHACRTSASGMLGAHVRNRTGTASLRVRMLDHRASWAERVGSDPSEQAASVFARF